ncbi:alpha/beta hydrolase [Legionella anisa]|uniref:Alpha/beta hydrolase n=1 Tax=Legionella anisa TaxID=28082 RepID=A0AAX0WXK7_9GAMM|nr:alpha/beta hydrolase [Legionella anisa]AWN73290.1 alpha/beta hydrolase [Legionella anisa]KTC69897.1 ATPases involved in biogenesis of archaeal flagella [Legionella anisa]MBN5936675.1 alpha/beta hydrolase [Legionella anisa]MCW8423046.1 alpha/beta hydrolase [Legionella anisa]MCW8447811.1 alpha/beta hydrolase [Legionella anisa]
MKYITRTVLIFFFICSTSFADTLAIKVDGKSIDLPYWPSKKEKYGAVLLINGGAQAQSSILLDNLANELAQNGWQVVLLNHDSSITVPWSKQFPEVVAALRKQKNIRLVVVHYGEQLKQTFEYLGKPPVPEIEGLILLSAYNTPPTADKKLELNMPVFDIVGQFDYDLIKQEMAARKKEFGKNKNNYLAIEIPGAHHDYEYSRQLLFSFIHGWMVKLPKLQPKSQPLMYSYLVPIAVFFTNHASQTM